MEWILLICFIIIIILLFLDYKKQVNIKTINKGIEEKNNQLKKENEELINKKDCTKIELQQLIDNIAAIGISAEQAAENFENNFKKASEQWMKILDYTYQEKEEEYDNLIEELEQNYDKYQDNIIKNINTLQTDLENIKNTRTAAIEAQIREKEIKEQSDFYCLKISEIDLADIKILEKVKLQLNKPRILCMLIWSTFFQKPMTSLCNNILGTNIKTGIYKITNQITGECYIGQAVDVASRWKDHAKCGLGIDTPANNKLYKAIQEYGIWNFSWELLEECSKELLNEKESYYIDLYDSCSFGYNSNKGIKKS